MNFYLTLPSNASSQIYSENNPGHYKVKLPRNIFLPENDWEVALASISFPDMVPRVDDFIDARVPILVRSNIHTKVTNDDGVLIPVRRWINNRWQTAKDKKGGTQYWHNAKCNAVVDLQKSDCTVFPTTVRSGYEICSRFINLVTNQLYQEMKDIYDYVGGYMNSRGRRFEEWKDESGKGKFPHFEWVLNADRYDLKINNEHVQYMDVFDPDYLHPPPPQDKRSLEELTKNWLANNHVDIELELAKKFYLVEEKTKSDGTKITCLSSSVRIEHFRDPNFNLWKSTDDLWRIVDIQWNVVAGRYVRFYSYVNWYFSGLDEKIYHTSADPKRTLFVYTDLTQTQIVGSAETDLLREVSFTNNEKGKYLFEPLHLQYLPIRKNVFDSVEVGISETDGSQVNFKDRQTILTINFRRSGHGSSEMSI